MSNTISLSFRILLVGVLYSAVIFWGCDSDDFFPEERIEVCNYDNKDYFVKLHRSADDVIVDEIEVEEGTPLILDSCEEFEDVGEGTYYLTIHEQSDGDPLDTSGDFHLDEDETERFYIDDDGDIHRT
jgi:hypothetical protein